MRDILKNDPQIEAWVRVVEAVKPDVLVIGDFDYDLNAVALRALSKRLEGQFYYFTRRPNRGFDSGRDLNGNGRLGEPADAEGYAEFAGQGGMGVLSRFPILADDLNDFSALDWWDLPETKYIDDGRSPRRLSTTVHWDLPVLLPSGEVLSLLIWHATAPVFDGPEDRNGRRNHDETQFWVRYVDALTESKPERPFLVMGTANADAHDGESLPGAIRALLSHPGLQDTRPSSEGGREASLRDVGVNLFHQSPATLDTVDWPDDTGAPGNLRVDYVLPASGLDVEGSGVFWPETGAALSAEAALASRHRLVWVDINMNPADSRDD
ncbi:MAG: endonuclease/exonuclease/phosphatase family protein [Pseudomonadota bacterium]